MDNSDKNSLIDKPKFFLSISDPSSVILFNISSPEDQMVMATKQGFNKIFHNELCQFGIEFGLKDSHLNYNLRYEPRNFSTIYSSNEYPVSYMKLASISWKHVLKTQSTLKVPALIFGNHYFALTTDKRFKFYVPELKEGFEKINDVLTALDRVMNGDISHIKIIHTEYLDLSNMPSSITCKCKVWSPYNEPGFDMTSTLNKKRFANLIKTRIEQRDPYIQDILKSLSKVDLNRMVIGRDVHGSNFLINATEISTVSVKDLGTQEISAEITLRNRNTINVNLEEFAKAFTDYYSDQTLVLVESLHDEREISIVIEQTEEDIYDTIWNETVKKFQIVCDEEMKKVSDRKLQSSDNIDNEDNIDEVLMYKLGFKEDTWTKAWHDIWDDDIPDDYLNPYE